MESVGDSWMCTHIRPVHTCHTQLRDVNGADADPLGGVDTESHGQGLQPECPGKEGGGEA